MSRTVGIDLGTTYSTIAIVNQHGKPEIVPNREGERITPSVVMFDGNSRLVGSIAKRSAVSNPLNVVQYVKRQMGERSWKFRSEEGNSYTAEEISAMILKRLKDDAETILNEDIADAVITVPAYFDDTQRTATMDAGKIAGLNVMQVINEPTAAALAYEIEKQEEPQVVLVYDLGGGTFDVTILRIAPGKIEVVATGGDKNLGGFDWDNKLMIDLNDRFQKEGGTDLMGDPVSEQDLRDKAEIAKRTLSAMDKTQVFLSDGGKNLSLSVTLEEFQSLTKLLLNRTRSIMGFVLEDADLQWSDIDKVLLVGGSTRMKAVPQMIEEATGLKPSLELHPDEVVAMGAAIQAHILESERTKDVSRSTMAHVEITDVNSHSLGVITHDDFGRASNSIVLKRNTPAGTRVSDCFSTLSDNQTELFVQVTQGEDENPDYVRIIGEAVMRISPYPRGAPVEIFFFFDKSQIVQIEVVDLTSGKSLGEKEFTLRREGNLTHEEVEERQRELMKAEIN